MKSLAKPILYFASALNFLAAMLHYLCIVWGADGFRFMGAGRAIVKMTESGHWYPYFIAAFIGSALLITSFYALTAAKGKLHLPLHRWILAATAAAFITRGLAFPLLKPLFPENSHTFWFITSALCLLIGGLYAIGARLKWSALSSGF